MGEATFQGKKWLTLYRLVYNKVLAIKKYKNNSEKIKQSQIYTLTHQNETAEC